MKKQRGGGHVVAGVAHPLSIVFAEVMRHLTAPDRCADRRCRPFAQPLDAARTQAEPPPDREVRGADDITPFSEMDEVPR